MQVFLSRGRAADLSVAGAQSDVEFVIRAILVQAEEAVPESQLRAPHVYEGEVGFRLGCHTDAVETGGRNLVER